MRSGDILVNVIGVDIGGTNIKGALVASGDGALQTDRVEIATPPGGEPEAVVDVVAKIVDRINAITGHPMGVATGICFPGVVKNGVIHSAANMSARWIGLHAQPLFEERLGSVLLMNDADAAGYAEARHGAARSRAGTVMVTTLGTGIGTALLIEGRLVPNLELGHLEIDGIDWETVASAVARERDGLSWQAWSNHLRRFYLTLDRLFSPDLFVIGGGVSQSHERFLPYLTGICAEIVPAQLRNDAGIIGTAALAAMKQAEVRAGADMPARPRQIPSYRYK